MNVALYLRRSTNEILQAESLRIQEEILRRYAKRNGMRVVRAYRDSASGTTTKHRAGFLALVNDVTHGASFAGVLVRDVTRFGRFFDPDEAAFYEFLFRGHGVETIYAEEPFARDITPMAGLLKAVRRVMAAEYSRDRARLVQAGQRRATREGFHILGPAPYGFRRAMIDRGGVFQRLLRRGEWKALSASRVVLVPGPSGEAATVRRIFEGYAAGETLADIVSSLNHDGTPSPTGSRWHDRTIAKMLDNPRFVGITRHNFRDLPGATKQEGVVEHDGGCALVARELWDRVQERRCAPARRLNDDALANVARYAYEEAGAVTPAIATLFPAPIRRSTFLRRFGGIDGALCTAYRTLIAEVCRELGGVLADCGGTPNGETWEFGGFSVCFRAAFLHRTLVGERWIVRPEAFTSSLLLCAGIGAAGVGPFFLGRVDELQIGPRKIRIPWSSSVHRDEISKRLNRLRVCGLPSPEAKFLDAVGELQAVNLRQLSQTLQWPYHRTVAKYHALRSSTSLVPPLLVARGRRVDSICETCGSKRTMTLRKATLLKTELCRRCRRAPPGAQLQGKVPIPKA